MLPTSGHAMAGLLVWLLAAVFLWWGRLPARWRRALALLTSASGLVALIFAINTEGVREVSTLGFLLARPYVTEQAAVSASLPYYVLTGVGLLLGTRRARACPSPGLGSAAGASERPCRSLSRA